MADDWPMWRHNAGRTGITTKALPDSLKLAWVRDLPPIEPAFHNARLQFDAGYEPVVAGGKVLIASSRADSLTAYESSTGREVWTFRTNGPVRFAPAVWENSVCFGSDDGHLYCVDLKTGTLRWKHQAVPSHRKLLGNRRLISVWPVRGGPVVAEGRVYFAAGVWPFEGVFVYAMDVESGEVVWRNDLLGYLFGQQPHNTEAIGGLAPQGYLVVNGDGLVVPCSTAYPARLNRATGELIEFELPGAGRFPGGWFAAIDDKSAKAIRRGKLTFDDVINRELHEDKVNKGHGESGISRMIRVGDKSINFEDGYEGVAGTVHSIVAADDRLFVTTREGRLYCFATAEKSALGVQKHWRRSEVVLTTTPSATAIAKQLMSEAAGAHGYAFVVGLEDGALVKALLQQSQFHVVGIGNDASVVQRLRQELQASGHHGTRAAVLLADFRSAKIPPYIASVVTTETADQLAESWTSLLPALRPFGGIADLQIPTEQAAAKLKQANEQPTDKPRNFDVLDVGGKAVIRRVGALPGTADYRGGYAHCEDALVRFPLGVLWFDDTLAHFKRSPQPLFKNGVMVSRPKDWHAPRIKGDWSVDYPLMRPVLSDIYTGRVFDESEETALRKSLPPLDLKTPQQSYYHAPDQKTALLPNPPDPILAGERVNPMTGQKERRVFPKTYGCDGGVDYGTFYTLRSGTAAFYDKSLESGTVFISGPRSGCTNSVIPSGGLLNVPFFYEGCTCSYPLPTALSMVAMPETHEQWSTWGDDVVKPASIKRLGLNFGAPGDRMTREGTLWLDYPSVGGPSPKINVETIPAAPASRYHHSIWMKDGDGWPWVTASASVGLRQVRLHDLKPSRYTVRLYFAELDDVESGARVQSVSLQGRVVLKDLDLLAGKGQVMQGLVRQFENVEINDVLTLDLDASVGETLINGIEIVQTP
jgi:outer membrane protein assembly factor BamB